MEISISLNNREREQLCQLLDELSKVVAGPLKRDVLQSKIIYCRVKRNLVDITITGNNITKLSKLLMAAAAVKGFGQRAEKLYEIIEKKKIQQ